MSPVNKVIYGKKDQLFASLKQKHEGEDELRTTCDSKMNDYDLNQMKRKLQQLFDTKKCKQSPKYPEQN